MLPCPSCNTHRRERDTCPHCGALPSSLRAIATVALLGLSLAGCPSPAPVVPEPAYGGPPVAAPAPEPAPVPEP